MEFSAIVSRRDDATADNRLDSNANEHGFDPPKQANEWTEERVALLIRFRDRKLSRSQIADEINRATGSSFTRNSVSGKIDRLFPVANPIKTDEEKAAALKARRERDALRKRAARLKVKARRHPADMNRKRAAIGRVDPGLSLVEFRPEDFSDANVHGLENLQAHHCRWIIGEDTRNPTFCGLHILDGSSYCSGHHRLVWTPPQNRRSA